MTAVKAPADGRPAVRGGGGRWAAGVGVLAGGMAALVVAQFLTTAPARSEGLPIWVRVAAGVLNLLGLWAVGMPLWRAGRGSPWTGRRVAFCLGAAGLGTWAVIGTIADIRSGLPGPAIPLLAVGCIATLVAAVLLAVAPPAPGGRGFVGRQALPAAAAVVAVAAVAVVVEVGARWIPVDATTAERVDPAPVPDPPGGVGWTSTWPPSTLFNGVVAAGAGVIVASGDRIVAIDGSTGAERWHHRWAGAHIFGLVASSDGRTVSASVSPGGEKHSSSLQFAFDANTGEVRWSRQYRIGAWATDRVFIDAEWDGTRFGIDLGSGEEIWRWKPPANCERNGVDARSPDALLIPVICRNTAGDRSYALIGVDDRTGTERWRFTGPTVTRKHPDPADLTTSPDGRVAVYKSSLEGRDTHRDPVLLESATGAVLYRTDGQPDIIEPDPRTPVLRREVPGAAAQLILRDLSTGAEHPLASTCPALRQSNRAGGLDEFPILVRPVVTSSSILVLCFERRPRATTRATIDVYSRSDGARTATLTATDAVGPIPDGKSVTGLVPAPGAVVLVVQHLLGGPTVVVGLT